jgi:Zn2+/Cd2+-exporting ATPase
MSVIDKIKSMFSGGSSAGADDHAGHDHSGHDHSGHDHSHEPAAPATTADSAEPSSNGGEDQPA